MFNKYKKLNDDAKEWLLDELKRITKDKKTLKRCKKELDLLYEKGSLFLVQCLYMYKKNNEGINYKFNGLENNLLLLYVLGMSKVNPLEYNLSYEIFAISNVSTLYLDFINCDYNDFINQTNNTFGNSFKICVDSFINDDSKEIIDYWSDQFPVIPSSDFPIVDEPLGYEDVVNKYLTISLINIRPIYNNQVSIDNVLEIEYEKERADIIHPKSIGDYVKIKSMSYGNQVWENNQEEMFKSGVIDIDNLISNRDDVYDYLIEHGINKTKSLEIMTFIAYGKVTSNAIKWNKYKRLMKRHNCDDWFIEVCSKIKDLFNRGHVVSECLYALDKNNYNNSCDIIKK